MDEDRVRLSVADALGVCLMDDVGLSEVDWLRLWDGVKVLQV